jgi:hypothetical protein
MCAESVHIRVDRADATAARLHLADHIWHGRLAFVACLLKATTFIPRHALSATEVRSVYILQLQDS